MSTTKQLHALLDAATPGPWTAGGGGHDPSPRLIYTLDENLYRDIDIADFERVDDAALVCAVWNVLPKLIAVVEAAEALSEQLDNEHISDEFGVPKLRDLRASLAALKGDGT